VDKLLSPKDPCLLCGGQTEDFIGLCKPCCLIIKAKHDAFAREAQRKLDEFKEKQKTHQEPEAAEPEQNKTDSPMGWWIKGVPL
jgi:hypothetical protein